MKKILLLSILFISSLVFTTPQMEGYDLTQIGSITISTESCGRCIYYSDGSKGTQGNAAHLPCCEEVKDSISILRDSSNPNEWTRYVMEAKKLDGGACSFPTHAPWSGNMWFEGSSGGMMIGPTYWSENEVYELSGDYILAPLSVPNQNGVLEFNFESQDCILDGIYEPRQLTVTLYKAKEAALQPQTCPQECPPGYTQTSPPHCECIENACQNTCRPDEFQHEYPDCSCEELPKQKLTALGGKIFYRDFTWDSFATSAFGFYGVVARPLSKVHTTLKIGSNTYDVYANETGEYLFTFNPPLEFENSLNAKLYVTLEDNQSFFYVGEGTRPEVIDGETYYRGDPFTFEKEFAISFEDEFGAFEQDFEFDAKKKWMRESARIYYNTLQSLDYSQKELKLQIKASQPMPLAVLIAPGGDYAFQTTKYGITIGDDCAAFRYPDSPSNREWHEFGHFVQDAAFDKFPSMAGDENHGSYQNPTSTDSTIEGWAETFSCLVNKYHGSTRPYLYPVSKSVYNVEANYKIVGRATQLRDPSEELMAASLMWDLIDEQNAIDEDYISMGEKGFWDFYRANYTFSDGSDGNIYNLADLYDALNSQSGYNLKKDNDSDGINNLDQLFIAHGVYQDRNKNSKYDAGEIIGTTLNSTNGVRRKLHELKGTNLELNIYDESGSKVQKALVGVDIFFEPPYNIYDYSYMTVVESDGKINLAMPDPDYEATAVIGASAPQHFSDEQYTITNQDYWEKVAISNDVFDTHDFHLTKLNDGECIFDYDCQKDMGCFDGACQPAVYLCQDYYDCPAGMVCENNQCAYLQCLYDYDCPQNSICENNVCVAQDITSPDDELCAGIFVLPLILIGIPLAFFTSIRRILLNMANPT